MAAQDGLYGSDLAGNIFRSCVAELVGTFFLVLVGTGTAVSAILNSQIAGSPADSLAVALSFGLTLVALVYALGHISGCHLNPAVTTGLAATGNFPKKYVMPYFASQFIGAGLASFTILLMYGEQALEKASLAATYPAAGVSQLRAVFIEMLVTFLFIFVILAVATDKRVSKASTGIAVGFTLVGAILVSGALTGGAVNPARAIGPMLVGGDFTSWWGYIIGPLIGGILGAFTYDKFIKDAKEPSKTE